MLSSDGAFVSGVGASLRSHLIPLTDPTGILAATLLDSWCDGFIVGTGWPGVVYWLRGYVW